MTWLTDELLSAYIDGELDPAEAARVALALTRDRDAVRRLNALRKSDALLREAFDWQLPGEQVLTDQIVEQMAPPSRLQALGVRVALVSLTALGAAVLGFGFGHFITPREVSVDPVLGAIAGGDLARGLETLRSDQAGPVQISMTFRAKDGRICRQFAAGAALEGVACRDNGRWLIEALSSPRASGGGDPAGPRRDPAGGAVETLGVAQAIDLPGEAALMRSGWR
jgi:hypothetical protein